MNEYQVLVSQIPEVVEQLRTKGADTAFAVLMFESPMARPGEDPFINLQYAIEDGVVGLEWVLLGPRNIEDKDLVESFMTRTGHTVSLREMNNVRYLRVDDHDLVQLGAQIIREIYQKRPTDDVALLVDGFECPSYRPAVLGNAALIPDQSLDDWLLAEQRRIDDWFESQARRTGNGQARLH